MPKEDSIWSSHPNISRTLAPETQPSPRLRTATINPAGRRKPIGLYVLTGALALIVLMCASLSVVLASIGPGTLLALRDRWLGRNLQETVTTIGQVAQVIATDQDVWPAPDNGRVTILLMGLDARDKLKEGASRTDVMTLVTIDPISKTAAMLSIPRDLYVPLPGYTEEQRINTAYFWGELNNLPGGGPGFAEQTITYNFGVPLHRYAVIDFEGFKGIVDAVGGIEIDVPREIVDYEYPTPDYRTEVLQIPAGHIHMDGDLALKYVRTRHADSDFGRLQRQQQVMLAIRDKAVSIGSLSRVPEVLNAVSNSVRTDLTLPEILSLAKKWSQIPRENIHSYRIDETMIQPYITPQGGQVLLPDRDKIAAVVAQFLGQASASQQAAQQ
ncbi:Polyisoprenyl-teichoic acid--peptidoglycan teichoic acid transferase TagV [Thermoflexales bacterium]|nr:Polyisoprenyl-teichoic acid--peptidoglycan teichoic acid transferase TagV [Thermoflexales bacterium]